ncbi:hypothetical protein QE396_004615 [Enterobacter sp. SORGH_AS 287]|nr:hypothetical protein [Enterobacter sp. SORGH_AS_0287]
MAIMRYHSCIQFEWNLHSIASFCLLPGLALLNRPQKTSIETLQ